MFPQLRGWREMGRFCQTKKILNSHYPSRIYASTDKSNIFQLYNMLRTIFPSFDGVVLHRKHEKTLSALYSYFRKKAFSIKTEADTWIHSYGRLVLLDRTDSQTRTQSTITGLSGEAGNYWLCVCLCLFNVWLPGSGVEAMRTCIHLENPSEKHTFFVSWVNPNDVDWTSSQELFDCQGCLLWVLGKIRLIIPISWP